jgi:hypothetical protein
MDDPKIDELRLIHKDLTTYLEQQHEAMRHCLLTVVALRKTVETRTDLHEAYKTKVLELAKYHTFQGSLSSSDTLETLLRRLTDW